MRRVAAQAYGTNQYGNGRHDGQSAEVAVYETLVSKFGFKEHDPDGPWDEDTYDIARHIVPEVISQIDDGQIECPCGNPEYHKPDYD